MKNKLLATVAVAAVVGFGGFAAAQSQMGGEFEQGHIWRDAGEKRRQHERIAIGQQDAQRSVEQPVQKRIRAREERQGQ